MPFGFQVGGFVGPLQAKELGQGWSVAHLQSQRGIDRIMAMRFTRVIIVVAAQFKAAKNPLYPKGFLALVNLPGFGLVSRIDALGRLLEQPADQAFGRFEKNGAHQYFQFGYQSAVWNLRLKLGDHLLDFLFLGKEDLRWNFFFFSPARPCRISRIPKLANSSSSCWNWANPSTATAPEGTTSPGP